MRDGRGGAGEATGAGLGSSTPQGFDVLAFTGYAPAAAPKRGGPLWAPLDAVVAGPSRRDQPSEEPLIASSNQELLLLSDLGRARYPLPPAAPRMQAVAADGELVMVGLPRPGDLERLEEGLRRRGVTFGGASWRG
jgi:anaerobic ribonucleoside-triphosphate reductase activating protein